MVRSRFTPLALLLACLAVLVFTAPRAAQAYPSSTPNAAWPTAKVDAQLKPHFRELIEHRHWRYERPGWSRWRQFYWGGNCNYGGCGGYPQCDPNDPYCQGGGGYPCDPANPYCQGGGYQCDPASPYCQGGQTYSNCDPASGYCQGGGGFYPGQPAWAQTSDPYYLPTAPIYGGGIEHITIDCRADRPGRLNEALIEVADGGTVHLKGKGPACTGTLQVSKPVIIQGDPPSAFPLEADAGPAVIVAERGAPCAVVDAGPRAGVEFRDLVIEAPDGGRSACIQTFSSAVALIRTTIHYNGESSALYVQGGRLVLGDTEIDANGQDAAIWAEDATIGMRNVGVVTASTGLDVRPGAGQTISLNHVSITAAPGGPMSGGPMSGVIGRRGRSGDCGFVIENSYVAGFRTGLLFEPGLKAEVTRSRIDQSRMGVAIDGAVLTMRETAVDATEYGVYAYSGRVDITGGFVTSVLREPFGADPGAILISRGVAVYADGCFGWGHHDGWFCHARHETPGWLLRREDGGFRHWGFNGY